jgi:hypothetical protein
MKVVVFNSEPDGRMVMQGPGMQLVVGTFAIDKLADALKEHTGSGGDGEPFEIDLHTGEIEVV